MSQTLSSNMQTSDDLEYGLLHLSLLDTEYIFSLHILGKMISNSNYIQMLAIVLLEDIAFAVQMHFMLR